MAWIVSLWSSSAFWEWVEYIAEAIVIAGAVVEVLTDFRHILKREENRELRERVGKYAAIFLVFGLGLELFALARTNQLFNETIASLTTQARDANNRAAFAETMASESDTRAETAERQAGSAIERAAKNELRAAELLKEIQPRGLSLKQQQDLASSCKLLVGHKLKIFSFIADDEANRFGETIIAGLKGIAVEDLRGHLMAVGGVSGTGVAISGIDSELAKAIGKALSAARIAFVIVPPRPDEKEMTLTIGPKPFELLK